MDRQHLLSSHEVSPPIWWHRWLWWGVLAGLVGIAAAALFLFWRHSQPHLYAGAWIDPIQTAPTFTLTDQTGQPFSLEQLKGKWVLLNYGYTSCPDVCPATLAVLGRVQTLLGDDAELVQVVFVTVDPERDSPEKIGTYVNHFGRGTIALTGTDEEIAAAAALYGVRYARVEMSESVLGYAVNHTALVYLINPEFEWIMVYPFGITPDEITADLRDLMHQAAQE
ncbi:MAG: SCO family protein [Anaerolineae bacterium]|nr:SCO family protein [Anaerolineae bacterium]